MTEVKMNIVNGEKNYSLNLAVGFTCELNGLKKEDVNVVGDNEKGYLVLRKTELTDKVKDFYQFYDLTEDDINYGVSLETLLNTLSNPNMYITSDDKKISLKDSIFYEEVNANLLAEFYEVEHVDGLDMVCGEGVYVHENKGLASYNLLYGEDVYSKFNELYTK